VIWFAAGFVCGFVSFPLLLLAAAAWLGAVADRADREH